MAYYSAFQSNAFQSNAFQIKRSRQNVEQPTGRPGEAYTYVAPYQIYKSEEFQREKIEKAKNDLYRIDKVIEENKRKNVLIADSRRIAEERKSTQRIAELTALQNEYLNEIGRLLMVRDGLLLRIRREEDFLVILIMARKRRFRVGSQPASKKYLH